MEAVSVELPWPPSVNRYYRVFRNRILISRDGRKYRMMVVSRLGGINRKLTGEVSVEIDLYPPDRRRRDIDNPLKCLLDSMTHAGVYEDDSQIKDIELHMREPMPPKGLVHVTLREMTMSEKGNEERDFIPEWRRRLEAKKKIVQEFMENLDDDTLFRAALLFMLGNDDAAVMKEMKLDEFALKSIKDRLETGLRLAGIETRK